MAVVICSLYINEWYRNIVKYGKISLEHYCEKHGYTFYSETEHTPNGIYSGKYIENCYENRDIPWYKIALLRRVFEQYMNADYIVWIDADSQIVNYDITIPEIMDMYSCGRDILVARDAKNIINTGVIILKNTLYSYDLLRRVWENTQTIDPQTHDQGSLISLYTRNDSFEQDHITILPLYLQNIFLSYWYMYYPGQCFIMHIMKQSHHNVYDFLFTMDMFCTVKMQEETPEQFKARQRWLCTEELCRADIEHYRQGGSRRNASARYLTRLTQAINLPH